MTIEHQVEVCNWKETLNLLLNSTVTSYFTIIMEIWLPATAGLLRLGRPLPIKKSSGLKLSQVTKTFFMTIQWVCHFNYYVYIYILIV